MLFEQGRECRLTLALFTHSQNIQLFCEACEHCREMPNTCRCDRVHFPNLLWISIQLNQLPSSCQGWIPTQRGDFVERLANRQYQVRLFLQIVFGDFMTQHAYAAQKHGRPLIHR